MSKIVRPRIQEMPRSIDRCSFVYLDQASINIDGGSIIAWRGGSETGYSCGVYHNGGFGTGF